LILACSEDDSPTQSDNQTPVIIGVAAGQPELYPAAVTTLVCYAVDADNDDLTYAWSADAGAFPDGSTESSVRWEAPVQEGEYTINVLVSDGTNSVDGSVAVQVTTDGSGGELEFALGTTGLTVTMIWIEADSFEMGAMDDEQDAENGEYPRHPVNIKDFLIGKYEVTQAQWQTVTDTCPSHIQGTDNPVENVSWEDVMAFIDTLNNFEDVLVWRLPSESEWEYVCRAGTTTRFPWGNDSGYVEMDRWTVSGFYNGVGSHAQVGSRLPNPWGVHDMLGNVWEWCEDKYHGNYDGAPVDGSAWSSGRSQSRMMRGGSWYDIPQNCRSATRNSGRMELRYQTVGFRLAANYRVVDGYPPIERP